MAKKYIIENLSGRFAVVRISGIFKSKRYLNIPYFNNGIAYFLWFTRDRGLFSIESCTFSSWDEANSAIDVCKKIDS